MAKKFGKFLMTTAALGALAASAYYFFWKKDAETDDDFDADDDFDDFDEDLEEEDSSGKAEADRKYVDLDLAKAAENVAEKAEETSGAFKEGLNAAKAEATDKIVGAAEQAGEAAAKVEEFFNDEDKLS